MKKFFKMFLLSLVYAILVTGFTSFSIISALSITAGQHTVAFQAVLGSFLCVFGCTLLLACLERP